MLFLVSQRKGVWPSHGGDHEECRGWSTGRAEAGGQLGSVTSCSVQAGVGLATKREQCRPRRPRSACWGISWSGGQAEKTSQHPASPFRSSQKPRSRDPGGNQALVDEGHSQSQHIPCSHVLLRPENWMGSWEPPVIQQIQA